MGKETTSQVRVTKYYASLHYGICHGPIDYISRIVVQEKDAWVGQQSEQGEIEIHRSDLFGGAKKEGGVEGGVEYLPGGPTQVIPEELASRLERTSATMPAYRGIASAWFHGDITWDDSRDEKPGFNWGANNPYLPGTWITVARASTALNEEHARIYRAAIQGPTWYIGETATITWWQRGVGGDRARMGLAFLNSLGDQINATDWAEYTSPITWTERSHSVEVPEGTVEIRVRMSMSRVSGVGTWNDGYIDDITLTVGGVEQTVLNPGAELRTHVLGSLYWPTHWDASQVLSFPASAHGGDYVFSGSDISSAETYQDIGEIAIGGVFDSNPAHIIYDCLTNASWGMGAPVTAIDVASFEYAAEVLYDEAFGLSMIWTKQTSIEAFVTEVIDHIEATLFVSPLTGLLTLKLIRDDYSISGLPEFTPDNSRVTKFSRKLWGETINEIIVTWTNPENEQEETVIAQDLANMATQGGIVSDGRNYYGVRTKELAMRLAQRDLRSAATPLASCDIEIDRTAWSLLPGDVVILNSPEDGIDALIMRVGPVDYGKIGDSIIRASLVEDVFSLALADYTIPPDTEAPETSEEPTEADADLVFTLPYYWVVSEVAPVADTDYPVVFAGTFAAEEGFDADEYDLMGEVTDTLGNVSYQVIGTKSIVSRTTLVEEIQAEAETIIDFSNPRTQGPGPQLGGFVLIEGTDETDSELCLITDIGSGSTYTLSRGVLDTVPRTWPVDTPVWFVNNDMVFADSTSRSDAEVVNYKMLIRTSLGTLAAADAPIVTHTLNGRPYYPFRPADIWVGGGSGANDPVDFGIYDATGLAEVPVTWAQRNRLTEDAVILSWTDADVTPEDGQTIIIEVLDMDEVVLTTHSGLTGTSFEVPDASFLGEIEGYIRVGSERDGYRELQSHKVHVININNALYLEDDLLLLGADEVLYLG